MMHQAMALGRLQVQNSYQGRKNAQSTDEAECEKRLMPFQQLQLVPTEMLVCGAMSLPRIIDADSIHSMTNS